MARKHNPSTIAEPAGAYSHTVTTDPGKSLMFISGQVAIAPDGSIPEGIEAQTEVVWSNIVAILKDAGLGVEDLVKVNSFLVNPDDLAGFGKVRSNYLGDARPASTLILNVALAKPEWLVEVEAIAEVK